MAKGLCGFPSTTKDATDDFMHRYYGVVQNQRTFADSWRYLYNLKKKRTLHSRFLLYVITQSGM